MQRRSILLPVFLSPWVPSGSIHALAQTGLPKAHDLRALASAMAAKREPLLILASLPGCPYCESVRRSYLLPYRAEGLAQSWQLDTTDHGELIDFLGRKTTPAQWLKSLGIKVMPTLLFLDASGQEIAPRIAGVPVLDFYGSYLDERLAIARHKLK